MKRLGSLGRVSLLLILLTATAVRAQTFVGYGLLDGIAGKDKITIDVPVPSVQANDILIAQIRSNKGANMTAGAAGWTKIRQETWSDDFGQAVFWKVAGASEPATYAFNAATTSDMGGTIIAVRGIDTTAPIESHSGAANSTTPLTAPSVNTVSTNAFVLLLYGATKGNPSISMPGGLTSIVNRGGNASYRLSTASGYYLDGTPGATGSFVATMVSPKEGVAQLLALKPASASGGIASFTINTGGGTASTCAAKNITITAKDSSGSTLTSYIGTINLTTSTGRGNWAKVTANGTLSGGTSNNGTASYSFAAGDSGVITLSLSNTHPDAALTITAVDSLTSSTSTTSSAIAFSDSAFVITPDPVQVAGRAQTTGVALWAKDSSFGTTCSIVTTYTGSKSLKVWLSRDAQDPGGAAPTIGALSLPNSQPSSSNLTLTFSSGAASISLATTDVGKYVLNLRDDASGLTAAPVGSSSSITTRPFGLGFTQVKQGTRTNPGGSATAGSSFVSAGDTFQVSVAGYLWSAADDANNDGVPDSGADITDNGVAPSWAWATALATASPFTPSAGTLGSLGGTTSIAQASFASGAAAVTNLTYSEAGSMTLQASATNYLGSAGVNPSGTSGVIGRFYPDHFALVAGATTSASCTAFSYMGQAGLGFSFSIEAQAKTTNSRLLNYHSATNSYAIAAVSVVAEDTASGNDGTDLSARLSGIPVPSPAWVSGRYVVSTTGATFSRATNPDGPFDSLQFGVRVSGDPGGGLISAANMNPATPGTCSGTGCDAVKLNAALAKLRYGRLRLVNGLGSQLLPVTLVAEAQYYLASAGGFATNSLDSCTVLSASNFTLGNGQGVATSAVQVNASSGALSSGRRSVTVSKVGSSTAGPGGTGRSSVDVALNLGSTTSGQYCGGSYSANSGGNLAHLRARWCSTPGTWDRDPTARAVFGVNTGADTLLMIRENY